MEKIEKTIIIDSLNTDKTYSVQSNEHVTYVIFPENKTDETGKIEIKVTGTKANVQILGIIIGQGNQVIRLKTVQDHLGEQSVSDLLIKSALFGSSRFYYEGLIRIEKDAQRSNAYQKNQNLLLSSKAWADSRPYLEILANDVRCTHGATIGKPDQEQLYYLASRGLNGKDATRVILEGFFEDVIRRIPSEEIQNNLRGKALKYIKHLLERELV